MSHKPCPFCGNTKAAIDTINHIDGKPAKFRGQCPDCGSATRWCETEGEAWKAWNRRAGKLPPDTERTNAECKKTLRKMKA
jgi:Lar family restriction alleviation protein